MSLAAADSSLSVDLLRELLSDPQRRLAAADRIKEASDFALPRLAYWNYSLCRRHRQGWVEDLPDGSQRTVVDRPAPGCRQCGIHFRKHQRVGVSWLYLRGRGLLADTVGSGKTAHAAGLIALLRETGELDRGKVLVVCRAPAILQWQTELARMIPAVATITATGTRRERIAKYSSGWEVCIVGPQMLLNDHELITRNFSLALVVSDDVDALRHRENRQAYALRAVAKVSPRMVVMTGTPLQKKLHELYATLEPLGGREVFGSELQFKRRYVREEKVTIYDQRTGRKREVTQVVGYKNLDEFKRLVAPFALRRTAADIDDVDLPAVVSHNVQLELYPAQQAKYDELRRGVLTILREEGALVKQATAMAKLHYGAQICAGLAALGEPDGPQTSVKLDWLMDQVVEGDLSEEKVVVFAAYKNTIRALHARLNRAGVGYETVWGDEPDKARRHASQERFWSDPSCRLLIGTQAIEQSLNLQVSRHLVNVDMIMNPARMEQLSGRIRRDGSAYKHVYVHNLLTVGTQEERYLPLLEREQALIDHIWNENSELFERLPPAALMALITG